MRYEKPELVPFGTAADVILGCSDKSDHGSDAGLCPSSGFATINAYEADE